MFCAYWAGHGVSCPQLCHSGWSIFMEYWLGLYFCLILILNSLREPLQSSIRANYLLGYCDPSIIFHLVVVSLIKNSTDTLCENNCVLEHNIANVSFLARVRWIHTFASMKFYEYINVYYNGTHRWNSCQSNCHSITDVLGQLNRVSLQVVVMKPFREWDKCIWYEWMIYSSPV